MMEQYQEFLNRIDAFEKPEMQLGDGSFTVSPSVALKVCEDQSFRNFYRDTVVFDLSDAEKAVVQEKVDILYQAVPECFCRRLVGNTFHMTLHDLNNSPDPEEAARRMEISEHKLRELLAVHPVRHQTIQMRSKAIFNMVNTSLVAGLYPVDEQEYLKLMALYELVDSVMELPYPLTPHITLAYYNSSGFDHSCMKRLENTVNQLNWTSFSVTLNTNRLVYQHFSSMN